MSRPDSHDTGRDAALGSLIREAWTDAPPAPNPDFLVQGLRPHLARIDAEIAERPSLRRTWSRIREAFGPVPLAAAAAAMGVALLVIGPGMVPDVDPVAAAGLSLQTFNSPSSIYDLAQEEDTSLLVFENDGATVIWILESEPQTRSAPEDSAASGDTAAPPAPVAPEVTAPRGEEAG